MPQNRQIVIAICVISWSLLLLPIVANEFLKAMYSREATLMTMTQAFGSTLGLPPVILPVLSLLSFLAIFLLACASTAELVVSRWGFATEERDDSA